MTNSIRELTEKIYNEGVLKATQDAEKILADAQSKADEILESARQEKIKIISQAQKEADELQRKTESEIRLATQKLMSNLKQNIAGLLILKQTRVLGSNTFNDKQFVKELILKVVAGWTNNKPEESGLRIYFSPEDEKNIAGFFDKQLIGQLNHGLEIKFDSRIKSGFKIGPQDGNYVISFTGEDFENYFKSYLKDKTWNLIFNEQHENNPI